jgi:hypothetical protein
VCEFCGGREIAAAAAGEGTGRTGAVESVGGFRFSKRKIITEYELP